MTKRAHNALMVDISKLTLEDEMLAFRYSFMLKRKIVSTFIIEKTFKAKIEQYFHFSSHNVLKNEKSPKSFQCKL